jgi:hypothetical protein
MPWRVPNSCVGLIIQSTSQVLAFASEPFGDPSTGGISWCFRQLENPFGWEMVDLDLEHFCLAVHDLTYNVALAARPDAQMFMPKLVVHSLARVRCAGQCGNRVRVLAGVK